MPDMPRVAVMALAMVAAPAEAQEYTFRYAPSIPVRTLTEIRTEMILVGLPAVPDGARLEREERVSATQSAVAANGAWSLTLSVDSVRARDRLDEGPWRDVSERERDGLRVRVTVNDRFGVMGMAAHGQDAADALRFLGAGVLGLGFAFPEAPVAVGGSFPVGGRLIFRAELGPEFGLPVSEPMAGDVVMTLDSVSTVTGDELAFLRFTGAFEPRMIASDSEGEARQSTFTGAFAGVLIWSAGWNAFVAGNSRVRLEGRIRAETPAGVADATITWDATSAHQVRP